MPRVICLQPVDKPIYAAASYGEITFIFSPAERPPPFTSRDYQMAIVRKLESLDYDPAKDFILLVGSFVPLIIFVSVVCEQYIEPQALAFDIRQNSYYPITLGIGEMTDEADDNQFVSTN